MVFLAILRNFEFTDLATKTMFITLKHIDLRMLPPGSSQYFT